MPIQVKVFPVFHDEKNDIVPGDVENDCDEANYEIQEEKYDITSHNDHILPSEIDSSSYEHNNGSLQNGASYDGYNDSMSNEIDIDSSTEDVKDDVITNGMKTVLVPIRDPVTRQIRHILVPIEVVDETGLNIIKSILVPVQDADGTVTYDIKKVIVPIRPQPCLPRKRKPEKKFKIELTKEEKKKLQEDRKRRQEEKKREEESRRKTEEEMKKEERFASFLKELTAGKGDDNDVIVCKEEVDIILDNQKNICPFCQRQFEDEYAVERHVNRRHKKPYRCDKCNKTFFSKVALTDHQNSYEGNEYLECPICHLKYKRLAGLKHHELRVHSNLVPKYICDYCGKRFKIKQDLGYHIDRTHMSGPHVCRFCGKTVRDIKHHEWKHERPKKSAFPYRCHLCSKKFLRDNNLQKHLLMHNNGFKCDRCNKVFASPSALTKHKDTKHKPGLLCTICEKTFYHKSNFYKHVLTHEGIRPYQCDVCAEYFTQRSSLVKHRKNHPGPLPPITGVTRIADTAKQILQKH